MADNNTFVQTGFSPTTIKAFVKKTFKLTDEDLSNIGFDELSILNFEDNGLSIVNNWTDDQFVSEGSPDFGKLTNPDSPINVGTLIEFPEDFLQKTIPFFQEKTVVAPYVAFSSFLSDEIQAIIEDNKYQKSKRLGDFSEKSSITEHILSVSVAWSGLGAQSLSKFGVDISSIGGGGSIAQPTINLTSFVISVSTNVGGMGGNFTLSLAPVTMEFVGGTWVLKKANFQENDSGHFLFDEYSTTSDGDGNVKRPVFALHHLIQPQDVIAIKFEELEIERRKDGSTLGLDRRSLTGGGFGTTFGYSIKGDTLDMLGLVDSCSLIENADTGDVSISIQGSDFSKMLNKDGAYFFPGNVDTTIDSPEKYSSVFFLNDQAALAKSTSFKRLFTVQRIGGVIQDIDLYINQPISFWLEYIMSKLSTAKVTLEENVVAVDAPVSDVNSDLSNLLARDAIGIWQMTKLITDPNIRNLVITDSTIRANSGSLMSFAKKVCQTPFVEFWTDTYGDKFYWIARKPPWAKKGFTSNHRETIQDDALLSYSLSFSDSEVYSWYKLKPILWYQGDTSFSDFNFVGVFFPEFADIYGARPLEVSSQYLDYGTFGNNSKNGLDQAYQDMRWLIEAHAHLVFTRKGTITINGDRRIKRGMCIYLRSTDELFYVDAVTNTYALSSSGTDRTTVLNVSRGIVLSHIDRYFEVIDFADDKEVVTVTITAVAGGGFTGSQVGEAQQAGFKKQKSWKVDIENFHFLLQRRQFAGDQEPSNTFESLSTVDKLPESKIEE